MQRFTRYWWTSGEVTLDEMMPFPSVWAPDLNAGPWHVVGGDREFIFEGDDEPDPMSLIYDPSDAPVATP